MRLLKRQNIATFEETVMPINTDYSQCTVVAPDQYQWVPSPQPGVERVMLYRQGGEKRRATSIVRYAPGSHFPPHQHPGGEEILVLSGTFSEDDQHYPAGWYLRNPPGSSHWPFSAEGAVIFVKLWQMPPEDGRRVRIDTQDPSRWIRRPGRDVCPLFSGATEQVALERLDPDEPLFTSPVDSAEMLVLAGELQADGQQYTRGCWIRLPAGEYPGIVASKSGTTLYLKTGHPAGKTTKV